MRNNSIIIALILFSCIGCAETTLRPETQEPNPCLTGMDTIQKHAFLPPKFKILSQTPVHGLCEIIVESSGKYFPLYVSPDYVLVGDMFQDQKAVTKRKIDELEVATAEQKRKVLDDCVSITYTPQERNIHRSLYMIADPDCHYCQTAGSQIKTISERYGMAIKLIIAPLRENNPKARAAICNQMNIDEYLDLSASETKREGEECDRAEELLAKTRATTEQLGVKGVPLFILDNGKRVEGANLKALEKEILGLLADMEMELRARLE